MLSDILESAFGARSPECLVPRIGGGGVVQRQRDLPGQGAAELLLLSTLFVREGYPDDTLHGAGEEDGVCGEEI